MLLFEFLYAAKRNSVIKRYGRYILTFILILLCVPAIHAQTSGYFFERIITVPPAAGNLTGFTLLVNITGDPLLKTTANGGHVQNSNGYDIIFTDQGNNLLDHQIEYYNGTTGDYTAWVKLPSYSATDSTRLKMLYGKSGVTINPSKNTIWNNTYKGVYHFNGNLDDASVNNHHGTAMNGVPEIDAQIGKGKTFNGTNAYIKFNYDLSTYLGGTASLTFWIRTSQKPAGSLNDAWELPGITGAELYGETNDIFWGYINKTGNICLQAGDSIDKFNKNILSSIPINDGVWHYVAITRNAYSGFVQIFADNVLKTGYSQKGLKTTPFYDVGRIIDNGTTKGASIDYFNGDLDELRIANTVLPENWLRTEYLNQSNPAFCHLGPERCFSDYYSISSGNWNDPANWSYYSGGPPKGTIPGANDKVYIQNNNSITLNTTVTVKKVAVEQGTLNLSSFDFTVTDTLIVSGSLLDNNNAGLNSFNGKVIINTGGNWNTGIHTTSANEFFKNGIQNNGNFTAGGCTFSANQSISGSGLVIFNGPVTIDASTAVTNKARVEMAAAQTINGSAVSSSWINDVNSYLTYQASTPPMTTGTYSVTASNNTVEYKGSTNQNIAAATYYNLKLTGTGVKIISAGVIVSGQLFLDCGNITVSSPGSLTLGTGVASPGQLNYTQGKIIGTFKRWVTNSGSLLFPIGTVNANRTIELTPTAFTAGSVTAEFKESTPGNKGLPLIEGDTITTAFTEGYWKLSNGDGFTSSSYKITLTGENFNTVPFNTKVRILSGNNLTDNWALNGIQDAVNGFTVSRNLMNNMNSAETYFCLGGECTLRAHAGNVPIPAACGSKSAMLSGNVPGSGTGTWNLVSGPDNNVSITNQGSYNTQVSVNAFGEYAFKWTITDKACLAEDTVKVRFFEKPSGINAGNNQLLCGLLTTDLKATPYSYTGDHIFSTKKWCFFSGPDTNPVFTSEGSDSSEIRVTKYGAYVFRWKETNGTCESSSDVTVNFGENPVITVTPASDTICSNTPVNILITGSVPGANYSWSIEKGNELGAASGTGNSIQQILKNKGNSAIMAVYRIAANGPEPTMCKADTVSTSILVEPSPALNISVEDTIFNNESADFQISYPATAGRLVFDLTAIPSDSISGYTNLYSRNASVLSQTLNNSSFDLQQVTYTFTPKIVYQNSSNFCGNGKDTSITILVNPTPRINVGLTKGISGSLDTICYNQGTVLQVNTPNKNIAGSVKYDLKVTVSSDSVQNTASEKTYNLGNLDQSVLKNIGSSLQTVTYELTPVLEYKGNRSLGTPVTKQVTIVPEIKYEVFTRIYAGGVNIRCYDESNGFSRIKNIRGGLLMSGYNYTWSNGSLTDSISNIKAGTYNVTVSDKLGCFTSQSITLSQPAILQAMLDTLKSITCYGGNTGKILISTLGGTQPYQYKWTGPGATFNTEDIINIYSGNYSLEITDANNCRYNRSYPVSQAKDITWNSGESFYSSYNISCYRGTNGSLKPQFKKGTEAIRIASYKWTGPDGFTSASPQIDNLKAGEYKLHVTDSLQCSADFKINLTQPEPITYSKVISSYSGNYNVQCDGANNGKISITNVKGGIGSYSFSWTTLNGKGLVNNSPVQNSLTAGTYKLMLKDSYCSVQDSFILTQPEKLNVKSVIPLYNNYEIACKNERTGSINLDVSGGFGEYTYNWYTADGNGLKQNIEDQTNLSAGAYYVTITYGGVCASNYGFTLKEPQAVSVNTASKSDVTCYGLSNGIIRNIVNGGIRPYTFKWISSNGSMPGDSIRKDLSAGGYTVEVTDANNCKASKVIVITQPDSMFVALKPTEITCSGVNDGSFNAIVSGGNGGYSYAWSNGKTTPLISGLSAGTYHVTVTDSKECKIFASGSLKVPEALTVIPEFITSYNGPNVSCYGAKDGSIFVNVSGGTGPYRFRWSNGDTTQNILNLKAETYQAEVTDRNGCKGYLNPVVLSQPEEISVLIKTKKDNTCYGLSEGALSISGKGGIAPYTFVWSNGQSGEELNNLKAGEYTVIVTDANSCMYRELISIQQPDTLKAVAEMVQPVCPDDKTGEISLNIEGGTNPYKVIWENNETMLTRTDLGPAIYSFRVTDMNNCSFSDSVDLQPSISSCVDAPTAFSPNGDGSNEYWEIYAGDPKHPVSVREMYPKAIIEVYTRWGTLIFRSDPGYTIPWNGTYMGRPLPVDSYYYIINPHNGTKPIKGIVTITR